MSSVPNPSLDVGQRALEQGNYTVAIAHFKAVCETELDESLVARASVGLVKAYHQSGDVESAITLCQILQQHSNPKVRQWAATTLAKLTAQPLNPANTHELNLQNLVQDSQTLPDATGFVALNTTPSPRKTQPRKTSTRKRSPSQPQNSTLGRTPHPASEINPVATSSPSTDHLEWRNSGRAQQWSPLKPLNLARLWCIELLTGIAFVWVLYLLVHKVMETTNAILLRLPFVRPLGLFYRNPLPTLLVILVILLIASPWLLDGLFKQFQGLEALSLTQLESRSPEAARVVQRLCRQRRLPVPKLGLLSTNTPFVVTYGNLPQTARIVISEGVLQQLADDEIATIYAGQLGHIVHWDFCILSLGVLALQIPYLIYWQVAQWGERLSHRSNNLLSSLVAAITGTIAALSYSSYWLLRLPLLGLSKSRISYSDRLAVETTGNPNGLTRAVLKLGLGIAQNIQTTGKTSELLESFDLMLPVGYRQAIPLSSCSTETECEAVLTWDCTNPYRHWLNITASHPLLGERLTNVSRYAQLWRLETELDLPPITPTPRTPMAWLSKLGHSYKALTLLQSALVFGVILGIGFRALLWIIGQISDRLDIWQLIWMHNAQPFVTACILVAFSLCLFLWINRYFPDIKPATLDNDPNVGDLYTNPESLPPDSQPVQLTGKLLGRRGLLNGLGQDLILRTPTGLVKLHFSSYLGPLGNLFPQPPSPRHFINQQVTVTGWFRRGATPWLDLETLRTQRGQVTRASYPIWLTLLAFGSAALGAYLIWSA